MKPAQIFLRAAEKIFYKDCTYCCTAIGASFLNVDAVDFCQTKDSLVSWFAMYFQPGDIPRGMPWFNKCNESNGQEYKDEETQEHRVMALLFMSEIAKETENE